MKMFAALLVVLSMFACNNAQPTATQTSKPTVAPSPEAPPVVHKPTISELLEQADTVQEALAICSPMMGDKFGNISDGSICLVVWMQTHNVNIFNVSVKKDETTPGLVFKNSEEQLGKRMCAVGSIIEIHRAMNGVEIGEISGYSGTIYHFLTVGGSGPLVEKSTGKLCGYVTGTYSYPNSGGGTTHTVDIAGAWDLKYVPQEY